MPNEKMTFDKIMRSNESRISKKNFYPRSYHFKSGGTDRKEIEFKFTRL